MRDQKPKRVQFHENFREDDFTEKLHYFSHFFPTTTLVILGNIFFAYIIIVKILCHITTNLPYMA